MYGDRYSKKTIIRKLHSIYPEHDKMIKKLVDSPLGFSSLSDVVRRAIVELYNVHFPPYKVAPTFKQKKIIEKVEAFEAIPEEQYVIDLGGLVYQTTTTPIAVFAMMGNEIRSFPLAGIKETLAQEEFYLFDHNNQVATWEGRGTTLKAEFEKRPHLIRDWNVVLPNQEPQGEAITPDMVQLTHDGN